MLHIHASAYNELAPVTPVSGVIPESGGTVGRGGDNAVILPDPSRMVSRRHLSFAPDGRGGFVLTNVSTANPVLVNERELDAGMSCPIGRGDRILIGNFLVEVGRRCAGDRPGRAPLADLGEQAEIARLTGLAEPDPLGTAAEDVAAAGPSSIADDFLSDILGESAAVPAASSPVAPPSDDSDLLDAYVRAAPRRGDPVEQLAEQGLELSELAPRGDGLINGDDGSPSVEELTRDPLSRRPSPAVGDSAFVDPLALFDDTRPLAMDIGLADTEVSAAGANAGSDLEGLFRLPAVARGSVSETIPEDPFEGLDGAVEEPAPGPAAASADDRSGDDAPLPPDFDWNEPSEPLGSPLPTDHGLPDDEPADQGRAILAAAPGVAAPPIGEGGADHRFTDGQAERPARAAASRGDARPPAGEDELYRAFLEGLGLDGLPDRNGLDPEFMRLVGGILRSCAQGTVDLMAARAAVKREVKASVTLIAPERNNPLKFSPDGEVALMYLLGRPYPGFMKPVDAVNHAFADLRAHQLGMISGMRSALGHVLERFNPDVIDREALRAGLVDSLLSIGRKARLWDAYGRYFETTRESAEDRFQEFFGSVFVDAYEEATTSSKVALRGRGEERE